MNFSYRSLPWNVVFGAGSLTDLPKHLDGLDKQRALVLSTPNQRTDAERVARLLGERCVGLFDEAVMHVPVATVNDAMSRVKALNADCSVAIGGGSTTGLGKALALKLDLPNIVIPTSYAGSEMTNIWGMTQDGKKTTGRDDRVVPDLTLYDPELTLSMPPQFAASSGLNAIAQAAVNIASANINPMVEILALEAVRKLAHALPRVNAAPNDLNARSDAQFGACLAGSALGTGSTGLHHRLCHTFGGSFDTPHAETHTVLLPYSIAFNACATATGTQKLASALGVDNAAQGLHDLARRLGAPGNLSQLGVQQSDLDQATEITLSSPLVNPVPLTHASLRELLQHAFDGTPPSKIRIVTPEP